MVFFESENPKPPGPTQFAYKCVLSHTGRKVRGVDKRIFQARFCGYFWSDEALPASVVPQALVDEYDLSRRRWQERKR